MSTVSPIKSQRSAMNLKTLSSQKNSQYFGSYKNLNTESSKYLILDSDKKN